MAPRIVVGVDGSETSRNALIWAARLALRRQASLDIVRTWRYPASSYPILGGATPWPLEADMNTSVSANLETFVQDCEAHIDLANVEHHLIAVQGNAGATLCEIAQNADLLVIGSRGLGGFRGLILGSVGAHCAAASPVPVAVVPTHWHPADPIHDDVVIGVDGSDNSHAAVLWADEWAASTATLRVISAWSYPLGSDGLGSVMDRKQLEEECRHTVAHASELIEHHAHKASCVQSDARVALPKAAAHSDMLVIGERGHGSLAALLLGSVASSIVHHLAIPTVLVPAANKRQ